MAKAQTVRMRDLKLNDEVPISLPAHVWQGFLAAYSSAEWRSVDANLIANEVQEALFDPVFIREQAAAIQEEHDRLHSEVIDLLAKPNEEDDPR